MYEICIEELKLIPISKNPFDLALKLSIAGNIMDYGANNSFDIKSTIRRVIFAKFAINHSKQLQDKIKEAKLVLLTDYRGITVTDVTKLRADLRNANAEYKVIKNNIIKRALDANGESALDEALEGPVALVIGNEDYLEPSKVIYNFTKDHDFYKIKGGVIEGKVMTAEEIITLAKLPSRQELLAKLAGALLGNITKLAATLDAVRMQKENA